MDVSTFIVRLVEALAWPVVLGLAFWNVRGQVGALVGRIQRLKWKDAEATFSEELDKVEDRAPRPSLTDETAKVEDRLITAQLPPAYIVQQAWLRVERAIDEFVKDRVELAPTAYHVLKEELLKDRVEPAPTANRVLRNARKLLALNLTPEDNELIGQLRKLRNEAVHSLEPDITVTDALRYKDLAESLAQRIEKRSDG